MEDEPDSSGPPSQVLHSFWDPRSATGRFAIAVILGVIATALAPSHVTLSIRAVVGWDVAAAALSSMAWWTILSCDSATTAARAGMEDPGRTMVFLIALASSAFSLFAGTAILRDVKKLPPGEAGIWTALALFAVVLSWVLTHTVYSLRYAHLYYHHGRAGGLKFPSGHAPSEIDFAYFSFTLGMCFQVSDVSITSSRIRRTVLGHALLSFIYNTTILALALNLVFGLLAGG